MDKLATLIGWAVTEIRELDELCRSMVPGYDPLHSEDMEKLARLQALALELESGRWRRK